MKVNLSHTNKGFYHNNEGKIIASLIIAFALSIVLIAKFLPYDNTPIKAQSVESVQSTINIVRL